VLPGFVVPVAHFAAAIDDAAALVEGEGVHAAQLALSLAPLPGELGGALGAAAEALGERLVCRSSSPAEAEASWSGAFTSFLDVTAGELATAVRGCVASVFRPEVEARLTGGQFRAVAPSVLVQRYLSPRCAGTAVVLDDGSVEVTAVEGSPAALLSGWAEGLTATLSGDGAASGAAVALVGEATLAALVGDLGRLEGAPGTTLEWAASGDELLLLQVGRAAPRAGRSARQRPPGRPPLSPDVAELAGRAARTLATFAGPLGEALLLPWALAPLRPGRHVEPPTELAGALQLAGELNGQALAAAAATGEALLDRLATRAADSDLRALSTLRPVDAGGAAALVWFCGALAQTLASDGAPPGDLFGQSLAALGGGSSGGNRGNSGPSRLARWQRLLQVAIPSAGSSYVAEPAAEGRLAGPARRADATVRAAALEAGAVLVVDHPLPRYAPLLWRAGALVACTGDASAHLFEVARARRIPAVIVRSLPMGEIDGRLALVDGGEGTLALLPRRAAWTRARGQQG